jgi:hypothetical protein
MQSEWTRLSNASVHAQTIKHKENMLLEKSNRLKFHDVIKENTACPQQHQEDVAGPDLCESRWMWCNDGNVSK